jgi:hypothetical protein
MDGGYILGGYSYSSISGDKTQTTWGYSDYWIIKIDSLGIKQWDKDFGGTDYDYCYSLRQTKDGGYILHGTSTSGISGNKLVASWGGFDYWTIKTDSLGNKEWEKAFGGNQDDLPGTVFITADNGYLLSGTSKSPISGNKTENNLGYEQTWIVKTDSLGTKQWDKTIFTNGNDETGIAIQAKDECYIMAIESAGGIAGYKTQDSWNSRDYWIIKFCDSTLTTSTQIINQQSTTFNIFPNPAQDQITVSGLEFPVQLKMYDVFGREVFQKQIPASDFRLLTSNFVNGMYIIKAYTGKEVFQQKLIINK